MNTLYLTQAEHKTFDAFSDALKDGWEVEAETAQYTDTRQKQLIRLSLVRLHDPKLVALRESVQKCSTKEEVIALLQEKDLTDVGNDELAELFFALGPATLSGLIYAVLAQSSTDKDLEALAALTLIRHTMLSALTAHAS